MCCREECCREVLERIVVENSCKEVLEKIFGQKCCRSVLEKSGGEECCREVVEKSGGEHFCREVLEKSVFFFHAPFSISKGPRKPLHSVFEWSHRGERAPSSITTHQSKKIAPLQSEVSPANKKE